jgi:hypothetical protein
VEIRYVLTAQEYTEGYRAMLRSSTMRYRVYSWLYSWPAMVLGLCILGVGLWTLKFGGDQGLSLAIVLFAIGVIFIAMPLRLRSAIRRLHRLQGLERESIVNVDANGVHSKRAMRDAETRFGWSAIERSGESKNLILLFPGKVQFIPIPKRAMTPAQTEELRVLIAANVPQRGPAAMMGR